MRRLAGIVAVCLGLLCPPAQAAPPERVVSLNLCTDQLALMLAAPGQLHSVSLLAQDPLYSPMAEEAQAVPANHGLAEEVFLLRPDLVLAGRYTATTTVAMLRRLGVRVEVFEISDGLEDVGAGLRRMGALLGREAQAETAVRAFEADMAALPRRLGPALRAALYYPNSYTSGAGSLADAILRAAGLVNLAAERGLEGMTRMPLETLVMARPDLVIAGQAQPTPALAEAVQSHPALIRATGDAGRAALSDRDWICGTPHVLSAIRALAEAAQDLAPEMVAR